jgi:spermidine synthase
MCVPNQVPAQSEDLLKGNVIERWRSERTKRRFPPSSESATISNLKDNRPFQVSVSLSFVSILLVLSTCASFRVGTHVRQRIAQQLAVAESATIQDTIPKWHSWAKIMKSTGSDHEGSTSVSTTKDWVHCEKAMDDTWCAFNPRVDQDLEYEDDSDDDEDPSSISGSPKWLGQQLLTEIEGLPEDSIAELIPFASSKGWSLQTYYQRGSFVTLQFDKGNRIVFNGGMQTLEIYSTENESLLDWVESMKLLSSAKGNWAYKPRGTHHDHTVLDVGLTDLYKALLGYTGLTYKKLVAREESIFQEIAIYDTIDPRYLPYSAYLAASSTNSEQSSYYTDHPHVFQPDRQMFLDGVVQSRNFGERAYHEALVHPAMLMHPSPQRVAIVGAGEGATLREVLKHSSVKQVVMIEIDQQVMDLSRKHLSQWNDCSDLILPDRLVNPTGNCFDDPRAKVYAQDAIRWFMDRFPDNNDHPEEALFDVIIMDALDPGDKVEFSDMLFANTELVATFHRALTPHGIFLCQTGEQHYLSDPNPILTRDRNALLFLQNLGKVGFHRLLDYDEESTRFNGIWSFVLASKATDSSRWYANQAQIDLELHQRATPTKSGAWPFHYFDGSTMESYQVTSRAVADVMCRKAPDRPACHRGPGLQQGANFPSVMELTISNNTRVFATSDIDEDTYLGLEKCVYHTWDVPHDAAILIDSFACESAEWEPWRTVMSENGMPALTLGGGTLVVDMGHPGWQRRSKESMLEPLEAGVPNPMLERYWRIHECASKRLAKEKVTTEINVTRNKG